MFTLRTRLLLSSLLIGVVFGWFGQTNLGLRAPTASAQSTQAKMRVLTFNTEDTSHLPAHATTPNRGRVCHPAYLEYYLKKSQFLASYMKDRGVKVGMFQEMLGVCADVRLTKDQYGREIIDEAKLENKDTLKLIADYKAWFKNNYSYEGNNGRSMSDAEFEAELQRVLGSRKVFEDVWVRFLPFDVTYWTALNTIFVEQYPMQVTTKPFVKGKTQNMRVATFSRYEYARPVNYAENADMIPIMGTEDEINSDTRWIVNAPINTPFGAVNIYNVHTRAGRQSCAGVKTAFDTAEKQNSAGSLFMLGGDFNATLRDHGCTEKPPNSRWDAYFLMHVGLLNRGETTLIDYLVLPKATQAQMSFDAGSGKLLRAKSSPFDPPDATKSEHDGLSYEVVGPQVQPEKFVTNVTLPDYLPHATQATTEPIIQPPIKVSVGESTGNQCFEDFLIDFETIRTKDSVHGMLLFSPFGDNPDPNFRKHLIPASFIPQLCRGATCNGSKVGVNPGTMFGGAGANRASEHGFDWYLAIAQADKPQDVISGIKSQPPHTKTIIRIGITESGLGFGNDPSQYINFLNQVWNGLSEDERNRTYAIAGPNEPDIEWKWFAKGLGDACQGHGEAGDEKSTAFYQCIGPVLANYMNAVITGNPGFKLLSPAFNMTSFTLQDQKSSAEGIFYSMHNAGANWAGLYAIAGNLYPNQVPMTSHWQSNGIEQILETAGLPLVITETGPFDCELELEVKREDYYIHPIKGISNSAGDAGTRLGIIRDDLISQGYRASCAGPGFKVGVTAQGLDAMETLFEQPEPNPHGVIMGNYEDLEPYKTGFIKQQGPPIYSVLSVDYRDALIPIFRDLDGGNRGLKQSLEQYFGFKNITTGGALYNGVEINSAAINSLVTNPQRCGLSYLNLLSREAMCNKLEEPEACALRATPIEGTGYTAHSLFLDFSTFYTQNGNATNASSLIDTCGMLMTSKDSRYAALKQGMLNAPLTMDEAYRLAFMVTTLRLRVPNPTTYVNIFTHPLGGWLGPPKPNHAVIITAFKIPDILTNKGAIDDGLMEERSDGSPNYVTTVGQGTSGNTSYLDPAILLRNSLITNERAYELERQQRCQRQVFQQVAKEVSDQIQDDTWAEISCLGGATGVAGVGSPQCKDPLSKALVDMINAQALLEDVTEGVTDYCALDPDAIAQQVLAKTGIAPSFPTDDDVPEDPSGMPITPEEQDQAAQNILDQITRSEIEADGEFLCTDEIEEATQINDPAGLQPLDSPGHVFTQEWGEQMLATLFAQDTCTHLADGATNDPSFASTQDPTACPDVEDWFLKSKFFVTPDNNADGTGNDLSVKHFFVYPLGYDLRTVESVLAGSFFSQKQLQALMEKALEKDRLKIEDSVTTFTGGSDSFSFTEARLPKEDYCEEEKVFDIATQTLVSEFTCPDYTIGFQLEAKKPPEPQGILGARLGFWMTTIQRTLTSVGQETHDYLANCASVEEFLMDQCGGGPEGDDGSVGNSPGIGVPVSGDPDVCVTDTTLESFNYAGESPPVMSGIATYYGAGVMNRTLRNRAIIGGVYGNAMKGNTTIKNCELTDAQLNNSAGTYDPYGDNNPNPLLDDGTKFIGCVAMLRLGDLHFKTAWDNGNPDPDAIKRVWIKSTDDNEPYGPFAVIDVAAARHAACLYDGSRFGGETWAVDIDFPSHSRMYPAGAVRKGTVCVDRNSCPAP